MGDLAGGSTPAGVPLQVGAPTGGSTGGTTLECSVVPPGDRPCGGGGGFARGSSSGKRRCPTAPHPVGEATAGASARGLLAPPDASLLQAGRRPAAADVAPVLLAFGCAARKQIEGSNCCCPSLFLRQRF